MASATVTASRWEALALILSAMNPNPLRNANTPALGGHFSQDVFLWRGYHSPVAWGRGTTNAQPRRIISDANRFNPSNNIIREEFLAMLVRAFSSPDHGNTTPGFSDWALVSQWARPYVRRAYNNNWIQGFPGGTLRPLNNTVQQDAVTFVNRASGRTPAFPAVSTITWNANGGNALGSWHRIQGAVLGAHLPTPTWSGRTFVGWYNTSALTGGTRGTASTVMPSGNVTYSARWNPPAPGNFRVTNIGNTTATLHWNSVSWIDRYRVYRVNTNGTVTLVSTPTSLSVSLNNLAQGTSHTFRLYAECFSRGRSPRASITFTTTTADFYGGLGFRYPLNASTSTRISSGYRLPTRPGHNGIDLIQNIGQPNILGEAVFAAHAGNVRVAGWADCAGWWVVIRSDVNSLTTNQAIVSRYMHFRDRPSVSAGNRVARGAQIGVVGSSGQSSGPHLHLDFNNRDSNTTTANNSVNPQRFFPNITFTGDTSNVRP